MTWLIGIALGSILAAIGIRMTGNPRRRFSAEEAREIGSFMGIDWGNSPFDVDQFRRGMDVELEHGIIDGRTDVTGDDPVMTAKIAWAHLNELPDYYDRLERMERGHGV